MCQYSAKDGLASNWHLVHLGARATGGAGLVMAEATSVVPEGRISPGDTGLWNDDQTEAFKPITQFIKSQGAIAAIQLAHAGRKASTAVPWEGGKPLTPEDGGWEVVGPSANPFRAGDPVPHTLKEEELRGIERAFVAAAKRSLEAGFEVVEIHMAHGYLLNQFLSPLSNQRSDQYGGSRDNRMRFPLQVTRAVRAAWPERLPLFVRISAVDWVEGGWQIEDSIALTKELQSCGVDLIDCSSGGSQADAKIPVAPGFQVPFAERIRRETDTLTAAVGLITEPLQAEEILQTGKADAVMLARELLRDPHWPLKAAHKLGDKIEWPKQYLRAEWPKQQSRAMP